METSQIDMGDEQGKEHGRIVIFRLGDEEYGIDVRYVREVIMPQDITPLPLMPSHVRGIINLRGKIITVVDLRLRFGLEPRSTEDERIIVVEFQANEELIGLFVDGVSDVITVYKERIESAPEAIVSTIGASYIDYIYRIGDSQIIIVLDATRLLTTEEILNIKEALKSA